VRSEVVPKATLSAEALMAELRTETEGSRQEPQEEAAVKAELSEEHPEVRSEVARMASPSAVAPKAELRTEMEGSRQEAKEEADIKTERSEALATPGPENEFDGRILLGFLAGTFQSQGPPRSIKRPRSEESCWDYHAGFCHRGQRCRWAHTGAHVDVEANGELELASAMASECGVSLDNTSLHELATLPEAEMAQLLDELSAGGKRERVSGGACVREVERFCRRYRAEAACEGEQVSKRQRHS